MDDSTGHYGNFKDENLDVHPVLLYPVHPAFVNKKDDSNAAGIRASKLRAADGSDGARGIPVHMPSGPVDIQYPDGDDYQSGEKRKPEHPYPTAEIMSEEDALRYNKSIVAQMFNNGQDLSIKVGTGGPDRGGYGRGGYGGRDGGRGGGGHHHPVPNVAAGKRNYEAVTRLPSTKPSEAVMCYICQGPTVKGKFDVAKAEALGVRPGKGYGALYQGRTWIVGDRIVYPHEVMGPDRPGAIFIVVDCPSQAYVSALVNNEKFAPHYAASTNNPVHCIVHILGDNTLDHPDYRAWMAKFGEKTQHIILSEKHSAKPIIYHGSAKSQHRLNQLDPDIYRIPFYDNNPVVPGYDQDPAKDYSSTIPPKTLVALPLTIYQMEPKPLPDLSEVKRFFDHRDPESWLNKSLNRLEDYMRECEDMKQQVAQMEEAKVSPPEPKNEVLVTTLGTGAALPSRYRNVSSTLVYVPGKGAILFDAGEGTYGQLYRRFHKAVGPSLEDVLLDLTFIFVSHMHADHHLGIISILLKRKELCAKLGVKPKPLCILGPPHYYTWLNEYADCEDLGLGGVDGIEFVQCSATIHSRLGGSNAVVDRLKERLGFTDIVTLQVEHTNYAYALSLTHEDNWKIVYSGDCRPSLNLMEVGKDADLLIHEATFEDTLSGEAVDKKHSTTHEAMVVCGRMNATYVVLTHFSQRYPKIPGLAGPASLAGRACLAFDLMSVKLGQLKRLPKHIRALKVLYPDEEQMAPDFEEADADGGALSGSNAEKIG
ncbi:Zinc phosphodiesterase ELAC protein 2, partial [Borealophlyctis nickersoniae]